jgi:leucyl aminopeptidase (aminopeptidase T)
MLSVLFRLSQRLVALDVLRGGLLKISSSVRGLELGMYLDEEAGEAGEGAVGKKKNDVDAEEKEKEEEKDEDDACKEDRAEMEEVVCLQQLQCVEQALTSPGANMNFDYERLYLSLVLVFDELRL